MMKRVLSVIIVIAIIISTINMVAAEDEITLLSNSITDDCLSEMVTSNEIPQTVAKLVLISNQVSSIEPLSRLVNLRILVLGCHQVTNLAPLENLKNLNSLALYAPQVSHVEPLKKLTNLRIFQLISSQVCDITPFETLTNLEVLDLRNNQITDLTPLYNLTGLQYLDLTNNPITYEQIKALQKELPDLRIYHNARPTPGHVLGNLDITIFDALEILKYIVGIDNVIDNDAMALEAALIVSDDVPGIFDVLEILKFIVGMPSEPLDPIWLLPFDFLKVGGNSVLLMEGHI